MDKAKDAGLLSPHVGQEWGGLGLDTREMAVVFEAAGYSLLGPQALNCAAPDEGNMHLLEVVASEAVPLIMVLAPVVMPGPRPV